MWDKTEKIFLDSIERTLAAVAGFLPALLAMTAVLLASMLFALLARSAVRRLAARTKLDQRLRAWGLAGPASEGRVDPSVTAARLVYWTAIALGVLTGLSAFDTTGAVAKPLLGYLPNALVALALIGVGLAGSRAIERAVLIGAVNAGLHSARLLGLGARWLVVVLATAMALEQLGVGGTILIVSFSILFGGIVLALSLAVGLGARATVARSLERVFPGPGEPPKTDKDTDPPAGGYHHV